MRPLKPPQKDPPCSYCKFVGVCGIDPQSPPCRYVPQLPSLSDDDGKARKKPEVFARLLRQDYAAESADGVLGGEMNGVGGGL